MAKQIGLMQLEGALGNVVFYHTKDGNFARQKPAGRKTISERVTENLSEFARAAQAGKLIRRSFASIINDIDAPALTKRLSSELGMILKTDSVSPRGLRNFVEADMELLEGFELNDNKALSTALKVPYTTTIDRETGNMKVVVPALNPSKLIESSEAATHYKFTLAGAAINFGNRDHITATLESGMLVIANEVNPQLELEVQVPVIGDNTLILALGLSFYQHTNGKDYAVGAKQSNALAFVAVSDNVA
ncbi:hypothetical protein [Chitinophaga cymbidii]|uniref:Uncharacterized protein n=1 Tax=Chitinophaga cymbidii TaxID=1096750 RepID=A0A512RR08_9BACT|nr:hypothetical protein [Chitinophaga cymbidii]GEP98106.1 hypothetical protein CCY01nite_43660 [Chitinophaga cymbidii]